MFGRKNKEGKAPSSPATKLLHFKDLLKSSLDSIELKAAKWEAPNVELEALTREERELESQRLKAMQEIKQLQKSHQNLVNSAAQNNQEVSGAIMEEQTRRYNELMVGSLLCFVYHI